ncbi:MAG: BON domain-containing protein [Calditrichaceae bacterium]|jgi:osmotically-inducible protein OsmY
MSTLKVWNRYVILYISMVFFFFATVTIQAGEKSMLQEKIKHALIAEGFSNITVKVEDKNIVRLQGQVKFLSDKYRVYDIAAKFPKVKDVVTEVVVKSENRTDEAIKNDIEGIYKTLYRIKDPKEIQVKVTNGVVQLDGKVEYHRIKIMAQTAASWVYGVKGIVNDIQVETPEGNISDLKDAKLGSINELVSELLFNWYPEENNVKYEVEDNDSVWLTGTVSSLWIKRALGKDVAKILGVTEVRNDLKVE